MIKPQQPKTKNEISVSDVISEMPINQSGLRLSDRYQSGECWHELAKKIIQALEQNHRHEAAAMLRELTTESHEFSPAYLLRVADALESDNWDALADDFINQNFIGKNGYVLLVGPFARIIEEKKNIKLTAIFAEVDSIPLPIQDLEDLTLKSFGTLLQPIPPVLPITSIATCGNIGREEAFLSPDGWCFPNSEQGCGIINLKAHRYRFNNWIVKRMQQIFEPKTAALILEVLDDPSAQLQEYYLHEAGHGAGLGMRLKAEKNLLPDTQQCGWEEYKTDIVGFYLAAKVLPAEQVGRFVAATLCIRFGIDAHRPGGADQSHDAMASLLILDRMLLSGQLQLLANNQLSLQDVSFAGLFRATLPHRLEAEELVRDELALIDEPAKVPYLYVQRHAHPGTKAMFNRFVERCR